MVGDAEFKARCFERIKQFKEQGKTMIVVTHDQNGADAIADRIMYLSHGRVVSGFESL
jgi:ABC-type polysaccharide/polyol phosphate transport system ATPase subunit